MSNNNFKDLDYEIQLVCNENYIDNAIISLRSFYKFNDYPITLTLINSNETDRFNEFKNVSVKYCNYKIKTNLSSSYKSVLEEISYKLKLFDSSKHRYTLYFDLDTIFLSSISECFKEYKTNLIGSMYKNIFRKGINVGFLIHKNYISNLYNEYLDFIENNNSNSPEGDFLLCRYKEITWLDNSYNYYFFSNENKEPIKMIHYVGENKPYTIKNFNIFVANFKWYEYFDLYYKNADLTNLSVDFINNINKIKRLFYKLRK